MSPVIGWVFKIKRLVVRCRCHHRYEKTYLKHKKKSRINIDQEIGIETISMIVIMVWDTSCATPI